MELSKAIAIFNDIDSRNYTGCQKHEAICRVADMETKNSITKDQMWKVIEYLLSR
jgi:hypothetical protein